MTPEQEKALDKLECMLDEQIEELEEMISNHERRKSILKKFDWFLATAVVTALAYIFFLQ